jgi:hypothetical protein
MPEQLSFIAPPHFADDAISHRGLSAIHVDPPPFAPKITRSLLPTSTSGRRNQLPSSKFSKTCEANDKQLISKPEKGEQFQWVSICTMLHFDNHF